MLVALFGSACQRAAPAASPLAPASSHQSDTPSVDERVAAEVGRRTDRALLAELRAHDDPRLQAYVSSVLDRVTRQAGPVRHAWTLRILDTSYVTVRSAPGGYVYLTRGLLAFLGTEAELAAALGHEVAHVTRHHWKSRMDVLEKHGIDDGDLSRLTKEGRLELLAQSRKDEREADELARGYLERAGYPRRGLSRVVQLFGEIERLAGGQRIPPELRTHPETAARLGWLSTQGQDSGDDKKSEYLSRIDGLLFGEDPRHGYLYAERYLNPVADLELALPSPWRARLIGRDLLAVLPAEDSVAVVSRSEHGNLEATRRALEAEGMTFATATVAGRAALRGQRQEPGGVVLESALFESPNGVFVLAVVAPPGAAGAVKAFFAGASRISEPGLANIAPLRVRLDRLARAMTLAEYAREKPCKTNLDTLALLNGVAPTTALPAGSTVKRIEP